MNEKLLQALALVDCGSGAGLTHHAQVLISRQAKYLLEMGLIKYAPELRQCGYRPTRQGYDALAEANKPSPYERPSRWVPR